MKQTVLFKSARFKVDLESFLSQHEIIYKTMPTRAEDGLPVGNGRVGALVYFPGHFGASISKIDVWDNRQPPVVDIDHTKLLELLKNREIVSLRNTGIGKPEDFPYPSPKICGRLKIESPQSKRGAGFEQRLSLYEAKVETKSGAEKYTTFICPEKNIMAVKFTGSERKVIELHRETDKVMGKAPLMGSEGRCFWVDYTFPDGFRYVMLAATSVEPCKIEKESNRVRATVEISSSEDPFLLLTVFTTGDCQDPLKAAKKAIEEGFRIGYESLIAETKKWWSGFWRKSFIDLDDDFLENLWYFQLYQLASTSRGDYAPGLFGLWNATDKPPWHGDYHEVNEQITYYPIFTANHQELGEPFYETFFRMLPTIKEDTKRFYGIEGAKYPHAMNAVGKEIEVSKAQGTSGCPSIRYWYMQCASALYAQVYWWHYLYTRDREFLKNRAYPVIKECTKFYQGYLSKDNMGKYYIYPSYSPEQGPWFTKNPTIDLAMIRFLFRAVIKAAEELSADEKESINWQEILEHLDAYPQDEDTLLESADIGKEDELWELYPEEEKKIKIVAKEGKNYCFRHISILYPIYPTGEFDKRDAIFKRTFDYTQKNLAISDCASFAKTHLACCAARLGMGDKALNILYDLALSMFLKPNGFFSYNVVSRGTHEISNLDYPEEFLTEPYKRDNIMLEMGSCFIAAINEMLLQSYEGIIHVFPALPKESTARFAHLRAEGAFLISSEMEKGVVKYISITSERGGECRIVIPWERKEVKLNDINSKKEMPIVVTDNILTFTTIRGHTYILERKKFPFEQMPITELKGKKRIEPRVRQKKVIEGCGGKKAGDSLVLFLGKTEKPRS